MGRRVTCCGAIILSAVCSFLAMGQANASVADIYAANNSVELGLGAHRLNYREYDESGTLDTEKGWLPAVDAELSFLVKPVSRSFWNNFYLGLKGEFAWGDTEYDGALVDISTGATTPYKSTTENTIMSLSSKFGYGFPIGKSVMAVPFIDLGLRNWERNLTGIGSYREDYRHGFFAAGAMLHISPAPRWVLTLSGEGGTTFNSQMEAEGLEYNLGEAAVWRFGGRIGYAVTKRLDLRYSLDYNAFDYGKSPRLAATLSGIPVWTWEPDSETSETRSMISVAYRFF